MSTLRVGRIPEAKKVTLKEMPGAEVTAALEQRPDLRLIKLADAAHDNWPNLAELAPPAHSSTDLKAATDAASGENNLRGRAQYEKYRHLVRNEPGGEARWMRLDEDYGKRGRAPPTLRGPARAIRAAVRLCAEYLCGTRRGSVRTIKELQVLHGG